MVPEGIFCHDILMVIPMATAPGGGLPEKLTAISMGALVPSGTLCEFLWLFPWLVVFPLSNGPGRGL
jgi:hypothetical protein